MTQPLCSVCKRPVVEKYKPFCSARCADVDLGRWLGETYRIPVAPAEEGEEKVAMPAVVPSENEE